MSESRERVESKVVQAVACAASVVRRWQQVAEKRQRLVHFASCLEVGEEVGSQLEAFQLSLCRGSLLSINITINRRYPSNLDCLRKTSLRPTRVCARQSPLILSLPYSSIAAHLHLSRLINLASPFQDM